MGGGVRAQYQLRQAFVFLNMDAVAQPEVAINNPMQRFDQQGNLTDEASKQLITQLLRNLVLKARMAKMPMRAAA
jgi:chromate reductase